LQEERKPIKFVKLIARELESEGFTYHLHLSAEKVYLLSQAPAHLEHVQIGFELTRFPSSIQLHPFFELSEAPPVRCKQLGFSKQGSQNWFIEEVLASLKKIPQAPLRMIAQRLELRLRGRQPSDELQWLVSNLNKSSSVRGAKPIFEEISKAPRPVDG